jgi:hypothetical protein
MDLSVAEFEPVSYGVRVFWAVLLACVVCIVAALASARARERIRRAGWRRVVGWWAGVGAWWTCVWIFAPRLWRIAPASAFDAVEVVAGAGAATSIALVVAALAVTVVWLAGRIAAASKSPR